MDKTTKLVLSVVCFVLPICLYGQTTNTHTVGATARTYSTITLCESNENNDQVADDEIDICECYDDADPSFQEDVGINGGTNDITRYFVITSATSDRHDGTAGSGVDIDVNLTGQDGIRIADPFVRIEFLEITNTAASSLSLVAFTDGASDSSRVSYNIFHDSGSGDAGNGIVVSNASTDHVFIFNNIIYNCNRGVDLSTSANCRFFNNSVDNSGEHGVVRGLCQNVISTRAGTGSDFIATVSGSNYNADEDGTAPGANSISSVTPDDEFLTLGSDYHLESGASSKDAGNDPSSVFSDDIDEEERPGTALDWDIGADEIISVATVRRRPPIIF